MSKQPNFNQGNHGEKKPAIECQYLTDVTCQAIAENEEVQGVRRLACANDNTHACCYLCQFQTNCEISCNLLGESATKQASNEREPLRCQRCHIKMVGSEVNLRVGGWSGLKQWTLSLGQFSEMTQELLPVLIYVCPNCGKIEFIAQEETRQKIINQSLLKEETDSQKE